MMEIEQSGVGDLTEAQNDRLAVDAFQDRIHEAVEAANQFQLHGFAKDVLAAMRLSGEEKDALAVYAVLYALDAPTRERILRLARTDGTSQLFGDQALVALNNFTQRWPDLKKKIEHEEIEIPPFPTVRR